MGEGISKFGNFMDIMNGSPLPPPSPLFVSFFSPYEARADASPAEAAFCLSREGMKLKNIACANPATHAARLRAERLGCVKNVLASTKHGG